MAAICIINLNVAAVILNVSFVLPVQLSLYLATEMRDTESSL
jgi:hypothetical protein